MLQKLMLSCLCLTFNWAYSQSLTTLPSGGNKRATVSEQVGLTDITIHYSRPAVKGREGRIWGQLVYEGFGDLGFGNSKGAPWRAGANENTTISFSNPVTIEGQPLAAGTYGFFIAYKPDECTLVFSKNHSSWGSYYYDATEDALRVKVKPQSLDQSVEWLQYTFNNQTESAATISLSWEKLSIPFKVETNYVNDQLNIFRQELRTEKGFAWQGWEQAAQWCLQHHTNLDQALLWSDSATGRSFGGDQQFATWNTKSQILEKLGKSNEAAQAIQKGLAFAGMNDMHQYARSLLQQKKTKDAIAIYKANFKKYPGNYTTLMGMARAASAEGDYKTALKYAQQALPLVTEINTRNSMLGIIEKLKAGKDIN
jgi:tetratricopeptide (TPR) repeat protein